LKNEEIIDYRLFHSAYSNSEIEYRISGYSLPQNRPTFQTRKGGNTNNSGVDSLHDSKQLFVAIVLLCSVKLSMCQTVFDRGSATNPARGAYSSLRPL